MARPPYKLFRVNTERVELVTPRMKRITIDGSCLPAFRAGLPAQWLKVFVPTGDEQNVPGRAYTIRRFDPVSKKKRYPPIRQRMSFWKSTMPATNRLSRLPPRQI
jgi:NADPH-dependent ferric siderophore reductase